MGSKLRVVLIVVGVLVVLILIAPFLIPVNQFRPTIEEKASAALGRKVELGDLSLSLISGSLSAENLSIGDDPKFSSTPFLTAKSLKVGVELTPIGLRDASGIEHSIAAFAHGSNCGLIVTISPLSRVDHRARGQAPLACGLSLAHFRR